MKCDYIKYKSPLGVIYIVAEADRLRAVSFANNWPQIKKRFSKLSANSSPILRRAKSQLTEYFYGKRRLFNLKYKIEGTSFQKKTWAALKKVPFGQTKSYKQQAELIKYPRSARAIGRVNSLNPLCIVLPCHRIICSNGSLSGYAGGIKVKKYLLKLEANHLTKSLCK